MDMYIGGRGLNMRFLYDEVKPGTDPCGPDSKIFFGVGPCNGTSISGSQRFNITAKSPLTGFLGDCNCGGDFGAELKYAGYDMLVIEGQSETPVYLWICDDQVEIRDASRLWGRTTSETRLIIEREVHDPDATLVVIGPAGENQVAFASIICDLGRAAGRGGLGAVLGSKKVKAVAVRGSKGVRVADSRALKRLNQEDRENWRTGIGGIPYAVIGEVGVNVGWRSMQLNGNLATHNFQWGTFETDMLGELQAGGYIAKRKACASCTLGCNHSFIIKSGAYAGTYGEGMELIHIGMAPFLGTHDAALLLKFGARVDELGLDMMETGSLISFAMECYEKGLLSPSQAEGVQLTWGNPEAILGLTEKIAHRKGLGDTLAGGLKGASLRIGPDSTKYGMHSKGHAMPGRDPRASKGWALAYATSSRGACHVRAFVPEGYQSGSPPGMEKVWPPEALETVKDYQDPTNPMHEEGKAELVKYYEDLRAFQDSLEICRFSWYRGLVDSQNTSISGGMAQFYNAVTGKHLTGQDVLMAGERINNLERAFNLREGLTRADDALPEKMLKQPMPDGTAKGEVVNLDYMLDRYYGLRGWDRATGVPTGKRLLELGLADVAEDLKP
ncbi:MAG: aldehyde ferredoxin oxidoreductase family protein, partial [Deltaproteobacteria bacterium]|nr:aldehyde ferredoxin oxidoreductase family protein [Deltaproteobacteria bacterium]